jgi:hypothetical protein
MRKIWKSFFRFSEFFIMEYSENTGEDKYSYYVLRSTWIQGGGDGGGWLILEHMSLSNIQRTTSHAPKVEKPANTFNFFLPKYDVTTKN